MESLYRSLSVRASDILPPCAGASVYSERKNFAAGARRHHTGDCSHHSAGLGFPVGVPSILLGLGLGLVMPEFLVMFVKLSHHCQRGTANTTHLLASEVGFASGIAVACYFDLEADKMLIQDRW